MNEQEEPSWVRGFEERLENRIVERLENKEPRWLRKIIERIDRLEERMDRKFADFEAKFQYLAERDDWHQSQTEKHDFRITNLEFWRNSYPN